MIKIGRIISGFLSIGLFIFGIYLLSDYVPGFANMVEVVKNYGLHLYDIAVQNFGKTTVGIVILILVISFFFGRR
ncbi:hypothetical protein MQK_02471 [Staphylococcus aureus subsp. aureus VRS6]|nr:hypothetical protein MQK_02471 [Staphylococcus aureus subsp. aureus VRS6]